MAIEVIILAPIIIILFNIATYSLNQQSIIWKKYFSHRPAPLVVLPRRAGVTKNELPASYLALELIDSSGLNQPIFFSPVCILIWRIMAVVFWIGSFFQMRASNALTHRYMEFYTLWTFTLFSITNIVGIVSVVRFLYFEREQSQQKWDRLSIAHLLLFECTATASFFLMLFYWAILYRTDENSVYDSLFFHGLNNIFFLVQVFFTRVAFISSHFFFVFLYTTVYAVFMFTFGNATGSWPYPVLNDSLGSLPYYFALPVLQLVVFFAFIGFISLRERISPPTNSIQELSTRRKDEGRPLLP